MILDLWYFAFIIPGILLGFYASWKTKSTFAKYSDKAASCGMTGAEAARYMLSQNGVTDVTIEHVGGTLTDHYDPRSRVLRLSDSVHQSRSIAAIGVACHEAGHALQHAQNYAFLGMRSALVPLAGFGSQFSYIIIIVGFLLSSPQMILVGACFFALTTLFTIITLPVEWDASARAKKAMLDCGMLRPNEQSGASAVLNAAFLTYLAAAVTSVLTLLYYLWRAGVIGGRR